MAVSGRIHLAAVMSRLLGVRRNTLAEPLARFKMQIRRVL
jgi:hypothetical protein